MLDSSLVYVLQVLLLPLFAIHLDRKPLLLLLDKLLEECTTLTVVRVPDGDSNPLLLLSLVPIERRVLQLNLHLGAL